LIEIRRQELLSKPRLSKDALHRVVYLLNDIFRSSGRRKQSEPKGRSKTRYGLGNGRQFWKLGKALAASHSECSELACFPGLRHEPDTDERHRDVAGDNIGERGTTSSVLNGAELRARHGLQQLHAELRGRANAKARIAEITALGLGRCDQIRNISKRC